ncbi:MAG: hypothetical protein GY909_03580 [Oligoflexia bacterium]|nr:hypothetical protein [Oligoflexia bacterium]
MKESNNIIRFLLTILMLGFFSQVYSSTSINYGTNDGKSENKTYTFELETKLGKVEFEIHADIKQKAFVDRVIEVFQKDSLPIFDYFEYRPTTNIHVVVEEEYTRANGAATVFPRNIMYLFTQPPVGSEHLVNSADWLKGLILHELIHIVHMDQTRGILKGIRNIFGSVGKLGGVTPRWFTEGIATWGEAYFTDGGRPKNNLFVTETYSRLMDDNFCDEIECLDQPLKYPYGQYPYWVGALFLTEVEMEKPGAIRCIVQFNSSQIPFFLNIAFDRCIGKTATVAFKEWRTRKRAELFANQKAFQEKPVVKKNFVQIPIQKDDRIMVFQRDFTVADGKLWTLQFGDRIERLVSLDLEDDTSKEFRVPPYIDRIVRSENENELLVNTSTYLRVKKQKEASVVNKENGELNSFSEIKGDYPFQTKDGKKYNIVFNYGRWHIVDTNLKTKKEFEEKAKLSLPPYVQIQSAQTFQFKGKEFVAMMVNGDNLKEAWQYWLVEYKDGNFKKTRKFSSFNEPTRVLATCDNNFLFHQENKILIGRYTSLDQARVTTLKDSWIEGVSALRWDENNTVVYMKQDPQNLYSLKHGCREIIKELREEARSNRTKTVRSVGDVERKPETTNVADSSYPSARHFLPHYWTINYVGGENLNTWMVSTNLNDPLDKDQIRLSVKYFPDFDEVTPTGSIVHDWGWLSTVAYYDRTFVKTSLRSRPDENELYGFGFAKTWEKGFFNMRSNLGIGQKKITDFVSTRDLREAYFNNTIVLPKLKHDDFFQGLDLSLNFSFSDVEYADRYMGYEYQLSPHFKLFKDMLFHARGTYGKLDKKGILDGVIYGGGFTDYDYSSFHSFKGLDVNDAFGNEMITYNLELDYKLGDIGWGWGLSPFYLKKLNLIAGQDFIKTEYIFTGRGFKRNSDLRSNYFGLRSSWLFGYMVPVDVDVIQYKLDDSSYVHDTGTEVIVRGTFEL